MALNSHKYKVWFRLVLGGLLKEVLLDKDEKIVLHNGFFGSHLS